jgi:hypothetical protein
MSKINHYTQKAYNCVSWSRRLMREHRAYNVLNRIGGKRAVEAMRNGFAKAERYRKWDEWSLSYESILCIAELVLWQNIRSIIEFGAGFSTIALSEYLRQVAPETQIDSFEHQKKYVQHMQEYLPEKTKTILHCTNLMQLEDEVYERLFDAPDPCGDFHDLAVLVPESRIHETRLKNVFYDFDFRSFGTECIDLIILDGPNGNGRSLAFPFLKKAIRLPGWVLIDDYLDYPFLECLQQVFVGELVRQVQVGNKEYVLVKLCDRR